MRLLRWQLPLKRAWTIMGSGRLFYCIRTRSFALSASAAECLRLIKVRFCGVCRCFDRLCAGAF